MNKVFINNFKGKKIAGILSEVSRGKDKPIVIIVHGFTSSKDRPHQVAIAKYLNEKKISTLNIDLFAHGESDGEFEKLTISKAVDSVLAAISYLKNLGYKKIILLGGSFGGLASLIAASKSKDLYLLILRCPVSNYFEMPLGRSGEKLVNWKKTGYRLVDGEKNLKLNYGFYEDIKNNNGYEAALKINVPTLIIHGDADEEVPVEQSIKTAKLIKNCQLEIIHGADHMFSLKPEYFSKLLKSVSEFIFKHLKE